jgi:hypothetical protein
MLDGSKALRLPLSSSERRVRTLSSVSATRHDGASGKVPRSWTGWKGLQAVPTRPRGQAVPRVAELSLNTQARSVSRANHVIDLEHRVFLMLEHLVRHVVARYRVRATCRREETT